MATVLAPWQWQINANQSGPSDQKKAAFTPKQEQDNIMAYFTINQQYIQVGDVATIGRLSSSHIVIANLQASRKHARLTLSGDGQYILTDLNSHNGTFVNGRKITEPTRITARDVVEIGGTTLTFWLGTPEHLQDEFATINNYAAA
jgi:pSer/pThr/pTyr-binding forkhead associated (FHA) protein